MRRTRKGDFTVTVSPDERDALRNLVSQLRELLKDDASDPSLRRLFPPAYTENDELETEYKELMSQDLFDRHVAALDVFESTMERNRISEDELHGWLTALNQLRLVLGTRLDVTEELDPTDLTVDDPRHAAFAVYHYLTWLQDEVVTALSS